MPLIPGIERFSKFYALILISILCPVLILKNTKIEPVMKPVNLNYSGYKFIYFLDYKETEGLSKFSDCQVSNCILTGNEHFIRRNGLDLFDAVVINVEGYKEDSKAESVSKKFSKRNPNQVFIMRLHESPRQSEQN